MMGAVGAEPAAVTKSSDAQKRIDKQTDFAAQKRIDKQTNFAAPISKQANCLDCILLIIVLF